MVCLLPLPGKLRENRNVALPIHPLTPAPRTGPTQSGDVVNVGETIKPKFHPTGREVLSYITIEFYVLARLPKVRFSPNQHWY